MQCAQEREAIEADVLPDLSTRVERLEVDDLPCDIEPVSVILPEVGSVIVRSPGDGHLRLGPGEPLVVRSGPGVRLARASAEARVLVVTLPGPFVRRILGLLDESTVSSGEPLCAVSPRSKEGRRLTRLLNETSDIESRGGRLDRNEIGRLARLLDFIAAVLAAEGDPLAPRDRRHARSRRQIREVARDLHHAEPEEWSLQRLADRLGLSTRQVSRLFQEELGSSFRDYVTDLRLERTRSLLARTDRSVTDVALESGWRSLSHFTTVFRSRVGMSPRDYRRALEADDSCQSASGRLE
jgi:AraC-like DNA-binding protein